MPDKPLSRAEIQAIANKAAMGVARMQSPAGAERRAIDDPQRRDINLPNESGEKPFRRIGRDATTGELKLELPRGAGPGTDRSIEIPNTYIDLAGEHERESPRMSIHLPRETKKR